MQTLKPFTITIFGASGDLAHRKLFPAIYQLFIDKLIGNSFGVVGYARSELTREAFIESVLLGIQDNVKDFSPNSENWINFAQKLHYVQGGYDESEGFDRLATKLNELEDLYKCHGNRVYHFSTPPAVFDSISQNLSAKSLAVCTLDGVCPRLVIEKPFGHDLASAKALNRRLRESFLEKQIYRIDHYLGKETVQNILTLRFSNILLESVWNNRYIDHIQITVAESLGVENRGEYYDQLGCTRDMVQNHLMQLLCITAMEPPNNIDSDEVRDEKVKILKALRPFDLNHLDQVAVRGQYGPSAEGKLKAYRGEAGISPTSGTDTYAACKIHVDNWRWMGVPFYIRTGKRMSARHSEIFLRFKDVPKKIFGDYAQGQSDGVLIRIQPNEGVSLLLMAKEPGATMKLKPVSMDFDYAKGFLNRSADAYERLLLDAILDKPALFIRADETETSWAFFEPLLKEWQNNPPEDFPNYFAGGNGPRSANDLLLRDGRVWRCMR